MTASKSNKNSTNKNLERMMAVASVIGFFGGWILLGHAPKPGTVVQPAQITAPAPSTGGLVQLPTLSSAGTPRLRTGGS